MISGMLWFCGDKYVLADEIDKACRRYTEKYGRTATMVYANPATIGEQSTSNDVMLRPARSILVNHLWVGEKSRE